MPKTKRTKWVELAHGYKPTEAEDLRAWLRDQEPDLDAEQLQFAGAAIYCNAAGDFELGTLRGRAIIIDARAMAEDGALDTKAGWWVSVGMVHVDSEGFAFEVVEA